MHAGWLLRMACNERMKEEFDTLHEAVVEILKVKHWCFCLGYLPVLQLTACSDIVAWPSRPVVRNSKGSNLNPAMKHFSVL